MITNHIRSGDLDSALYVFDNMTVKTTVTWNSVLAGLSRKCGKLKEAQELFVKIPEPDAVSYNTMLSCHVRYVECGDLDSASKLFEKAPFKSVVAWTAMITGYMKIGRVGLAERLFQKIPEKNLVTWNAMIAGYIENYRAEDGVKILPNNGGIWYPAKFLNSEQCFVRV
ncbi:PENTATRICOPEPTIDE REPEAT-CONTAINING PROTEIN [Salix purpurea]|uniref:PENTATRICOPEPTIDE REPEAT-CONTAINING PROTEIN n=1 Tax=Salix purpurea TaxID=77065 RepID=A0A9Q0QG76_SALPP|nr:PENTATRICOPEPTIDE REPEAT-CONTAINING PROTEIN [Salix purpurea]